MFCHAVLCCAVLCRLLKAFDLICLTNAVFTSFMLVRTFGIGPHSGFSWHYQIPTILYGCMNVTQLALLLLQPNVHQAYRFQVCLCWGLIVRAGVGCSRCFVGNGWLFPWSPVSVWLSCGAVQLGSLTAIATVTTAVVNLIVQAGAVACVIMNCCWG